MMRAYIMSLLLLTPLALSACGFSPVYGTYAKVPAVQAEMSNIYISNIPNRLGQNLRNALIDSLYTHGYPGQNAPYILQVQNLQERKENLGIAKDASATRTQINLSATVILQDSQTKTVLLKRYVQSLASYDSLPSQYTTLVSADSARSSATEDMKSQIVTALQLYFSNPANYRNTVENMPSRANNPENLIHNTTSLSQ